MSDAGNGRTRPQSQGPPAHGHGRRPGGGVRGAPDRHSLVRRLPALVLIAGAVAAAVAVDEARGGPHDDARPPTAGMRPDTIMPASPPARLGSSTWYCAAGTAEADGMADHTVVMANPTDEDLRAKVTVSTGAVTGRAPAGGTASDERAGDRPVVATVRLPAGEQVALRLGDVVEAPLAAALVEVDGGDVAVEHRVTGPHGTDVAPCATTAASTWHFAWGSTTRDAREVVVLYNPFPSSATVDAVFTTEDGWREPVRLQGLPVPGGSVVGVEVGDDVTRSAQVSATFEARSGRVVVERLQQYDGSLGVRGLSLALGAPAPQHTWVFADGAASAPAPTAPDPAAGADPAEASDGDAAGDG
ncbi:MAG: hypothetical protein JXA83_03835, partial [Acidimicrobiales bacterium]|nr:hypothetical protein [Acidimicrobiales bacterium]